MSDIDLKIEIDVAQSKIRACLLDLHLLAPLHPLIESIELQPSLPARPNAKRYRVVDQIPVGPFQIRARYIAELEPVSDIEVHARAWQSPGVHLKTTYFLRPQGDRTLLEESVIVDAPFLLRRFVISQASKAHSEMLAGLKMMLEAAT